MFQQQSINILVQIFYLIISIILLIISPILLLLFNVISLIIFINIKIETNRIVSLFILTFLLWVIMFVYYSSLLTALSDFPFGQFDVLYVNQINLEFLVHYCLDHPSICRANFLETVLILFYISQKFKWRFFIFFIF